MPWPFDATPDAASASAHMTDMERSMRAFPWETTAVGPVACWPHSLKSAVRTVLDLRLPAYLAWGDSYVQFFNDAYVPILGDKKDGALGNDARVTWSEIWPTIGPMWAQVRRGEALGSEGLPLTINRYGYYETCYFSQIGRAHV